MCNDKKKPPGVTLTVYLFINLIIHYTENYYYYNFCFVMAFENVTPTQTQRNEFMEQNSISIISKRLRINLFLPIY